MRSKFREQASSRQLVGLRNGAFAIGCAAAFLAFPVRATTPGTPGAPQPATPIFIENFQNANPATWIRLTTYAPDIAGTGSTPNLPPKPAGESYTADPPWLTACNGMVLSFNSGGATPAECGASGWAYVRQLAQALGQVDGMTQAQARQNLAVAAFTQNNPGADLTQFRTSVDVPFSAPSTRFLTFSVDAAAVSCFAAHPAFQFAIFSGAGAPIPVGSSLNPCAAGTPTRPVDAIGGNGTDNINAARFTTDQSYPFTGTSLGVLMRNAQGSGGGNDAAFDNIRVYDATPQLDKAFNPVSVVPGQTSVLTLTVTNTSDLASKLGFSFTDTLPLGLAVATAPGVVNTCGGTVTASGSTITLATTAPPASGPIPATVTQLASGVASCAVSVNVVTADVGNYSNGPDNITASVGLNPPGTAVLASGAPAQCSALWAEAPGSSATNPPGNALYTIDPSSGAATVFASAGPISVANTVGNVSSLAIDPRTGRMFAVDNTTGNLRTLAPGGAAWTDATTSAAAVVTLPNGTGGNRYPRAVMDGSGNLYIGSGDAGSGSPGNSRIFRYPIAPDGSVGVLTNVNLTFSGGTPPATAGGGDFAIAPNGNFYYVINSVPAPGPVQIYFVAPSVATGTTATAALVSAQNLGVSIGSVAFFSGTLYLGASTGAVFTAGLDPASNTWPTGAYTVLPETNAAGLSDMASCAGTATVQLAKISHNATGTFGYTGVTNLAGVTTDSITTTTPGVAALSGQAGLVATLDAAVTATETVPPGYVLDGATCTDANSASTGNPASFGGITSGSMLTIPAVNVKAGAAITCTFTNTAMPDLSITKTDDSVTYTPGGPISYTIVAGNAGPAAVVGATVTDTIPPAILGATWTCAGAGGASCPASGSGDINAMVDIPAGGTATFSVTGTVSPSASGNLANTATIAPPAGVTDLVPGNNSATDTDTPAPVADLSITKTDGSATYTPGSTISYTIVASNAGPSDAVGAIVTDTLPTTITGASWTCTGAGGATCPGGGSGDINATVNIPVGGTTTFTVTGTVSPSASGDLVNTAAVTPPSGTTDPDGGNNSATDTDTTASIADLAITKTDGSAIYTPGSPITYTIVVSNAGPSDAVGATVADTIPPAISGAAWTAVYSAGASGPPGGSGDINATVTIPAGGTATFTLTGTVAAGATGPLSNTATVTPPGGTTDPVSGNNSATDTDAQGPQLTVAKSVTPNPFAVGQPASYAITVTNSGGAPTSAPITIADTLPAGITLTTSAGANWTCTGTTALSCTFAGTLAAGASTTLTLNVDVAASATNGDNTAIASGGGDPGCPAATRCVGTVVVPVTPMADIVVLKTVDDAAPNVGEQVTFTITATNLGPSDATGVAITDGLPFGMTLVSATPSVGTFDPASGLWTIGALADGASQTLTLTVSIDVAGSLTNHAVVSASDLPDPDPSNNSAAAAVNAEPSADIGILKTVDHAAPNVGSDVTYTLTVTNHGPSDATGVEVTDNLPAGVSFAGAVASQGSYDSASGVWTIGALANGASATLAITVHVDQAGSISNTATVTHEDQFDPNPTNNSSGTTINGQSADLGVTKTVDDAAPTVGDDVVFTITIHNNGPSDATNVVLTDQLPATLSFVSATPSQGSYAPGTGLWSIGTLTAAGPTSTATLTITATVVDAGATTNTATVTGADQPDPNPANNSDNASLNGNPLADLAVVKSGPAAVTPGDDVVYTIVVTNHGPSEATNVVVADATPAALVFVGNAGACTTAYPCSIGTLASGASATITTTYTVPADYSGANPIVNTASASSDTPDPDPTDNQSSAQTGVGPGNADLAIVKNGPAAIASGGAIQYTLLITNGGPSPANGASYSDVVPAGITGITATCGGEQGGAACGTQPSVTGNTVSGVIATLPSSGSVLVTIDGTAPLGPLTLSNSATVTPPAGVADPDPSNNQDDVDTAVGAPMADLAVQKTGPASVLPGSQASYTVTVTNNGPDDALDAMLDDPAPPGLSFASATPPCAGGFPCDLGTLAAGTSVVVTITFDVDADVSGDVVNTANVGSDTPDPDPSNNEDSVTTPVAPQANLAAVKTGPASVGAGGAISYTVVVTNAGPSSGDGALFSDPVPAAIAGVTATCGNPTGGAVCGTVGVAGNTVTSTITTLPAGGSVSFTIGGTAPANATGLTNTAGVEPPPGTVDPDPSDNEDSVDTDVIGTPGAADLAVVKTGPASVAPGSDSVYTIVVTNHGPDPAANVVVSDPTPSGLVFVSNAGACVTAYPCALGTLASGASATITTTYSVPAAYAGPNPIANTASVGSDTPDPNASNNSDTATTPLAGTPQADLVVTKSGPAGANAGQTISYAIQVVNHGPDAVTDAVLVDPTPAGLSYVSSTAPCAGGFPCALPPLSNGASVSLTVSYTVQPGYSGTITNVADAQSPTVPDPDPENNTSTVSTPIGGPVEAKPVPVDARLMLMLMGLLLAFAGASRMRSRR